MNKTGWYHYNPRKTHSKRGTLKGKLVKKLMMAVFGNGLGDFAIDYFEKVNTIAEGKLFKLNRFISEKLVCILRNEKREILVNLFIDKYFVKKGTKYY